MDWLESGKSRGLEFLNGLKVERSLVDYEGPRSFFSKDLWGSLLFAHQCAETDDVWYYTTVPFNEALADQLEHGQIDLTTALSQPRLWVVGINVDGVPTSCSEFDFDALPESHRPDVGQMLYPEYDALLSLRSVGRDVDLVDASLVLLDERLAAVRTGLRKLATAAARSLITRDKKPVAPDLLYDIPTKLLAGSVQIGVYPPVGGSQLDLFDDDPVASGWRTMSDLLNAGLSYLSNPAEADDFAALTDVEKQAVLQAIYHLAPPERGRVNETVLAGRLIRNDNRIKLKRGTRAQLNARLREDKDDSTTVFSECGEIKEVDTGQGTCELRDESGTTIRKLIFDHDLVDQTNWGISVIDALTAGVVTVISMGVDDGSPSHLLHLVEGDQRPKSKQ